MIASDASDSFCLLALSAWICCSAVRNCRLMGRVLSVSSAHLMHTIQWQRVSVR